MCAGKRQSRALELWSCTASVMSATSLAAASPGLGTINHTLLTIESARSSGLEVAAVVLTPWPERPTAVEQSNLETIASVGEVEVQTLPRLDLSAPSTWPELSC